MPFYINEHKRHKIVYILPTKIFFAITTKHTHTTYTKYAA